MGLGGQALVDVPMSRYCADAPRISRCTTRSRLPSRARTHDTHTPRDGSRAPARIAFTPRARARRRLHPRRAHRDAHARTPAGRQAAPGQRGRLRKLLVGFRPPFPRALLPPARFPRPFQLAPCARPPTAAPHARVGGRARLARTLAAARRHRLARTLDAARRQSPPWCSLPRAGRWDSPGRGMG